LIVVSASPAGSSSPKPAPTPTPTEPPSVLYPQAIALCEASLDQPESGGASAARVLTLLSPSYDQEGWYHEYDVPGYEALSSGQVQAIVCIWQTFTSKGVYTDGESGYQVAWRPLLVRWPTGEVLSTGPELQGDEPPYSKSFAGPVTGDRPSMYALSLWLAESMGDTATHVEPGSTFSELAFSPDSAAVAAVADKAVIMVWDVASGGMLLEIRASGDRGADGLAYTPNGDSVLTLARTVSAVSVDTWSLAAGQSTGPVDLALVAPLDESRTSPRSTAQRQAL
jgi:WD40 repeat protein